MKSKIEKLLVIGPDSIHTSNYFDLVSSEFNEALLVTDNSSVAYELCVSFSIRNPISFIKNVFKLRRILKRFGPTVIHVQQANTTAFLAVLSNLGTNIPLIITAWGSDVLLADKMGFLYKWILRFNLRHAKGVTADAKFMLEVMNKQAGRKLNALVANFGIDLPQNESLQKQKIIYSNRAHNALYRVDKIIKAFEEFRNSEKGREWKLIIAGIGDQTEELKKMVRHLGIETTVEFIGWIDRKSNYDVYNKAMIYVSFPETDATSISLLEAMACWCIPIVSDLDANREWIENEKNGLLVENISGQTFSHALKMDFANVISINKEKIIAEGTRDANRTKFMNFYKLLINE